MIIGAYKTRNVGKYLDENANNIRIIFPTGEDLQNSEFQLNIEEALPIYSKFWNKLKIGDVQ